MRVSLFFMVGMLSSFSSVAGESTLPRLDRPYRHLHRMEDDTAQPDLVRRLRDLFQPELPRKSNTLGLLDRFGPVRDQAERGTCSIFSATAALEWLLSDALGRGGPLDLSEQWLSYVSVIRNGDEGSEAPLNNRHLKEHGIVLEEELPYEGMSWETLPLQESILLQSRCGTLKGELLRLCRLGHYPPEWIASHAEVSEEFLRARISADRIRSEYLSRLNPRTAMTRVSDVKASLASGVPVIFEFDFYHGAWQSGDMEEMGLGTPDAAAYRRGEVGYPEEDSLDRSGSLQKKWAAGHSVLVVGYDDSEVITTRQKMQDGSFREFTYRGVYYFRNSWGSDTWGSEARVDGALRPGYGKVAQKYAHQLGAFFQFEIP